MGFFFYYYFNRLNLIVVHLHFSGILVEMLMCLLVMKLLLNYKPRADKALCLIVHSFFFFGLISLGVFPLVYFRVSCPKNLK